MASPGGCSRAVDIIVDGPLGAAFAAFEQEPDHLQVAVPGGPVDMIVFARQAAVEQEPD
jgi:hypothetical protein